MSNLEVSGLSSEAFASAVEKKIVTEGFVKFPEELDGEYTAEEFHRKMTANNSDIPIERVRFLGYPGKLGYPVRSEE